MAPEELPTAASERVDRIVNRSKESITRASGRLSAANADAYLYARLVEGVSSGNVSVEDYSGKDQGFDDTTTPESTDNEQKKEKVKKPEKPKQFLDELDEAFDRKVNKEVAMNLKKIE